MSLVKRFLRRITPTQKKSINQLLKLADRPIYLVGGQVRDTLMSRNIHDIDIAVEGDAIKLAKKFKTKCYGKIVEHKQFGTATVTTPNGTHIDFVTTRKETYPKAAKLPVVVKGATIIEDLSRRDFTVNAMAIPLNGPEVGKLIDPFSGKKDIRSKIIRVLHDSSYRDDPIRAYRAHRYAERFGFKLSKNTKAAQKNLIAKKILLNTASDRIFNEIKRTFEEDCWIKAINSQHRAGLFKWIHPQFGKFAKPVHLLDKESKKLNRFFDNPVKWAVRLTATIASLPAKANNRVTKQMPYSYEVKKSCTEAAKTNQNLKKIGVSKLPSVVYKILNPLSEEAITALYIHANNKVKKCIIIYLKTDRNIKPPVDGKDLINNGLRPGPDFQDILWEFHAAKLDGLIHTKKECLKILSEVL